MSKLRGVVRPIPTAYAGCRFRSRLEARWAMYFDCIGIPWEYELEGFVLSDGRCYLPDFLLPECGTWIEVKGHEGDLDRDLMLRAAADLPAVRAQQGCEEGPKLMVLGPIPEPPPMGDFGWVGMDKYRFDDAPALSRYGFSNYPKNSRPWWLESAESYDLWLTPTVEPYEWSDGAAYCVARSARFEHGGL